MKKILHYWLIITIIALSLSMALISYWSLYPYEVITFNRPPLEFVSSTVKPGEKLEWYIDVTHHTKGIKVDVVKQVQDGYIINYPQVSYITSGGRQQFINSVLIPEYAQPGTYVLSVTSIWNINPIRKIKQTYISKPFKVQ